MSVHQPADEFPAFFDQAPVLRVHDALAQFLGAVAGGVITYRYVDAVRLAGHSCPTVAGAYLMVVKGLGHLYADGQLPERGGIEVMMAEGREDGATGVVAAVATLLTGAAPETGFAGIGPAHRFGRRNLLRFDVPMQGVLALRRLDSGQAVQVALDASIAPFGDEMRALMPRAVAGAAHEQELARFAQLWQARVKTMLVDEVNHPQLVQVMPFDEPLQA